MRQLKLPYAEKSISLTLRLKLGGTTGSVRTVLGETTTGVVVGAIEANGLIATANELAVPNTRLSSAVGTFGPSVNSPSWNDRMFRLSWKWKKFHPNWTWWPRQLPAKSAAN